MYYNSKNNINYKKGQKGIFDRHLGMPIHIKLTGIIDSNPKSDLAHMHPRLRQMATSVNDFPETKWRRLQCER